MDRLFPKRTILVEQIQKTCEYTAPLGKCCGKEAKFPCGSCGIPICEDCAYFDPRLLLPTVSQEKYCFSCLLNFE